MRGRAHLELRALCERLDAVRLHHQRAHVQLLRLCKELLRARYELLVLLLGVAVHARKKVEGLRTGGEQEGRRRGEK